MKQLFKYLTSFFLLINLGLQIGYTQRVFAVTERGFVQEVKEGEAKNGAVGIRWTRLNKNRPISITEPLAFYISGVDKVNSDEWFLFNILDFGNLAKGADPVFYANASYKKDAKKHSILTQIADNLFELKLDKERLRLIKKSIGSNKGFTRDFVLAYLPNKEHKKKGDVERYWYIAMSKYESYDGISYTSSQVENAINEIISTNTATKQLFASIVPAHKNATQNNNVQYVVVQSPQANSGVQSESQSTKVVDIPDSDVDIDIPYSAQKRENAFAVVIANENYNKVASVPYALRDGEKVKDYLIRTLGFDKSHVTFVENATLNDMKYELNRLSKISDAYNGDMSLVVYYCGHGIPDEKNGNGYLLPVDGYGNDISTAFSIEELYRFLGDLKAKQIVLFMDACFSGASKDGDMLVAARGIAIKSQEATPTGNLIVFSACQGDETAYPYKEKGHGLMTYYLLKKLQDTKGNVTLGDLEEYIQDNVTKTAIVTNGKPQTPSIGVSAILQDTWKSSPITGD